MDETLRTRQNRSEGTVLQSDACLDMRPLIDFEFEQDAGAICLELGEPIQDIYADVASTVKGRLDFRA